jgi:hypothetical protein
MQVVQQTEGKLVLQERPWLVWGVSALLAGAGLFVALTSDERLFGAAFVVVGVAAVLLGGQTVTCTFDRATGQVTRETRGWPRSGRVQRPLADVRGVRLTQGSGRQTYRVELALPSGDRLPLTTTYSSGKADQETTARLIRDFLGLPDPGELQVPGIRDLVGIVLDRPEEPRPTGDRTE